jgi:hypothetical protein
MNEQAEIRFHPAESPRGAAGEACGLAARRRAVSRGEAAGGRRIWRLVQIAQAVEAFWKQVCAPLLLQRRRRMLPLAEARAKEALENPGQFDVATLDALKQKAYELAESPTATLKDVKAVLGLLLKARSEDRADRELTFEREKFEFDAAKSCLRALPDLKAISTSKTLSEPQKVEQIRLRLFGKIPAAQS